MKVAELKQRTEYKKKQIKFVPGRQTVIGYGHSSMSGDRAKCRDTSLLQLGYQVSSRDT